MYETQRVPMTSSWQSKWLPRAYTLHEQSVWPVSGAQPGT